MKLNSLQLQLLHAGKARLDNRWNFDNVISPFYRLYLIKDGSGIVNHSNEVFNLKPGHLYLIPSFTFGRYFCEYFQVQYYLGVVEDIGDAGSVFDHFNFSYEVPAVPADELIFKRIIEINPGRNLINDDPKVYDRYPELESFKVKNQEMPPSKSLETHGLLQLLLSRFIRHTKISEQPSISEGKIQESAKFIRKNLHRDLTVQEVADAVNLSTDYFSSIFQKTFGIRPLKYIQSRKIERAQVLLATTNDPLPIIAEKTGFEYVSYMSRLFKQQTGKSPGQYRKDLLGRQ
ncbi:AraC family transcriptional regulator [Echinicola rosea]|uniref:HTH araC/xylS-type domain-containing protein n=1 Tax=Echinicola rosea TaxID=1807691 RepID=A0ABQ1V305_9BACT|nr:AraC family transcriptional regulator [Echinicola rosea]GGF36552.1 hypothetical protein GCM10011339_26380 [Echinicola rosea]